MHPPLDSRAGRILLTISLLAAAGMAVSSLSLYHHYGTSTSSYCDFGASFNCDMVNRSIYSVVLGVPVALIGVLGYAALFMFSTLYRRRAQTPALLLLGSSAGLGFTLYLAYVENFILAVWCVLCLSSLGLILATAVLSGWLMKHSRIRD
jgi:vitamin-K-epoxide reductase (warfarin-sensitive)